MSCQHKNYSKTEKNDDRVPVRHVLLKCRNCGARRKDVQFFRPNFSVIEGDWVFHSL